MTSPTQVLKDEHVLILRALDVLETGAGRLEASAPPAEEWWTRIVAWLRGFADHTHHAKEENLLFPALLQAGVPGEGGPVGVMLAEHAQGRGFIAAIETGSGAGRVAAARGYVRLLRAHIDKENEVLFPLADAVLEEATMRKVADAFDGVAAELGREGSAAHAEAALAALAAEVSGRSGQASTAART